MAKQLRLDNVKLAKGHVYEEKKLPKGAKFVYAEVKKDGLRGFVLDGKLYTASGVRVVNAPLVEKAFKRIPKIAKQYVFDGEMFYQNCDTTKGIVKTQTPDHPWRNKLVFYMFDCISRKEWDAKKGTIPLKRRKVNLQLAIQKIYRGVFTTAVGSIKLFDSNVIASTDKAIQAFHKQACKDGHEGTMIKNPLSVYAFRKNNDWLKLKPFWEDDLKIVNAESGTGRNKHRLGKLHLVGKINGKKVKTRCGGGFSDAQRDAIWKMFKQGKLVGKIVEVEHEGLTKKLAVRFPQFRRFHPEKNED